jgi:hypothetical protein
MFSTCHGTPFNIDRWGKGVQRVLKVSSDAHKIMVSVLNVLTRIVALLIEKLAFE